MILASYFIIDILHKICNSSNMKNTSKDQSQWLLSSHLSGLKIIPPSSSMKLLIVSFFIVHASLFLSFLNATVTELRCIQVIETSNSHLFYIMQRFYHSWQWEFVINKKVHEFHRWVQLIHITFFSLQPYFINTLTYSFYLIIKR